MNTDSAINDLVHSLPDENVIELATMINSDTIVELLLDTLGDAPGLEFSGIMFVILLRSHDIETPLSLSENPVLDIFGDAVLKGNLAFVIDAAEDEVLSSTFYILNTDVSTDALTQGQLKSVRPYALIENLQALTYTAGSA